MKQVHSIYPDVMTNVHPSISVLLKAWRVLVCILNIYITKHMEGFGCDIVLLKCPSCFTKENKKLLDQGYDPTTQGLKKTYSIPPDQTLQHVLKVF